MNVAIALKVTGLAKAVAVGKDPESRYSGRAVEVVGVMGGAPAFGFWRAHSVQIWTGGLARAPYEFEPTFRSGAFARRHSAWREFSAC